MRSYKNNIDKYIQIHRIVLKMSEAIQNFQKQLRNKLEYKASSKVSPDSYLYKCFKFFDLYNNGYLGRPDFFRAIAKCGVVVDSHDAEAVYNYYDTRQDGNIQYKEFIQNLLFSQSQENSQLSESQRFSNGRKRQPNAEQIQKSVVHDSRKPQMNQSYLKESKIDRIYNQCQTYAQVANLIKRNLTQRGIPSLLSFAVDLKSTDTLKTHKIGKAKLKSKLNYLPDKAIDLILAQFSNGQSSQINYAEFIYSLKGQPDQNQQIVIQKAFNLLDSNNEKQILIQRVVRNFKNTSHKNNFVQSISFYEDFQGIDDGVFTDEDFIDFFSFLAFSFADSQKFIFFVEKAFLDEDVRSQHSQRSNRSRQFKQEYNHKTQGDFKQISQLDFRKNKEENRNCNDNQIENTSNINTLQLSGGKNSVSRRYESKADIKSTTTSIYVKEVQMIVMRIKKRLASKGTRGFLLFQKSLRNVDRDQDGLINLDEFKQVVKDLKIDITNNQSNLMFDVFDPDSTNFISYSQMVQTIRGSIPQRRKQYFLRVWNRIKSTQQHTTFSQIRHSLNFRGHYDVQNGRRFDDQIQKEVQDTILLIQQLNQSPISQKVSKKQFWQYLQNLSLTTSDDMLFESLLQNFWKMQSKTNINQMYAGSRKLFDPTANSYLMDHHRHTVKGGSISSNAPFGTSSQPTNYFTENGKL